MNSSKDKFIEQREMDLLSKSGSHGNTSGPVAILNPFKPSKSTISNFQENIRLAVLNGELSALEVLARTKTAQKYVEAIIGDGDRNKGIPEVKELARSEAEGYGEKIFEFKGFEVQLRELGTRYDFAGTNDPEWILLQAELTELKTRIKNREDYLKTLEAPIEVTNFETGEVITVTPPVKKSTSGLMFSLK